MADIDKEVLEAIPHRPPFLFVDKILECGDSKIRTERTIRADEPHFEGHYPGMPLMPGVLLCEALVQSGAIFISRQIAADAVKGGVPVLTRLSDARFKQMVRPGDRVEMEAEVSERLENVFYMKGRATVNGRKVLTLQFACTVTPKEQ